MAVAALGPTVPLPPLRPPLVNAPPLIPPATPTPWPRTAAVNLPPRDEPPLRPAPGFRFMPGRPASACAALAAQQVLLADEGEMVAPGACGGPDVMRILAIRLKTGKLVDFVPAAILRCEMAARVAQWVRNEMAPAAEALGSPLKRIDVAASYHCRPRNNVPGAPLSEHGRANALDIKSFLLENGRLIAIASPGDAAPFFAEVKRGACQRFSTILGPGSDAAHSWHLHVDLAPRRNGYSRMCQWHVPTLVAR
jgi:hypothetical protein